MRSARHAPAEESPSARRLDLAVTGGHQRSCPVRSLTSSAGTPPDWAARRAPEPPLRGPPLAAVLDLDRARQLLHDGGFTPRV